MSEQESPKTANEQPRTLTTHYVLICRLCEPPLPMPFESAAARGKWAAAHKRGTGHDRWTTVDQTR